MTDASGQLATTLADRYRLERELGRGGMATVYLAHDLRHDRKVAIKVLHPELAALLGGERFLNEIRVTAHLQHPHILALYDSGAAAGNLYYVMPYVEGESLRQRLTRERQLPIADSVRITREVADALDYAHRRGVIHRDIKPENILLQEGRALVADFGIALAVRNAGGARITQTGLSLGTPEYMSPEQATAERELDLRSDVYSLGCVLYEMLAGEPPHTGPTTQSIIAKIVADKPRPITQLRETVPPGVAAAVHTALAKLAADRFGSAGAFAAALGDTSAGTPTWLAPGSVAPVARVRLLVLLGLVAALGTALGWLVRGRSQPETFPPSQLSIIVPDMASSGAGGANRQIGLTPDGSGVILGGPSREYGLRLRRLDQLTATPIPGSELLFAPQVSPDGRWMAGRNRAGDAMLLPLGRGGASKVVARAYPFLAWHPDGSLWVSRAPYRQLERLLPGKDSLEVGVNQLDQGYWIQQILDDGRTGLVIQGGIGTNSGNCFAIDLRSGKLTPLVEAATAQARYSAGYLVYVRADGNLVAAPLDVRRLRLTGPAVTLAEHVGLTGEGEAQFAVARNGTVAYIPEEPGSVMLVDRSGAARPATETRQNFHAPSFSPDGRRVAMDIVSAEGRDVWILDLDQGTLARATFARDGHDAVWTPDGRQIAYSTFRSGALTVYRTRPGGGAAAAESLLTSRPLNHTGHWLPDGSGLITVVNGLAPGTGQDIAIVRNGGRGPVQPLISTRFQENYPAVSPDGHWVAFVSDQSGERRVYVHPIGSEGDQIQVSQGAASEPVWSRDGREIFYRSTTANGSVELVAAQIQTSPAFRVVTRQRLFPVDEYVSTTPHAGYDVSPDGKTFVMVRRNAASRIVVIQNLPELVKRLSGTAKPN